MVLGASVDDIIEHFGVKGMRWGVRKSRTSGGSSGKKSGGSSSTRGSSQDAAAAARYQARAKKSGTQNLSNKELKHLVERMRLEDQYKTLAAGTKKSGSAFMTDMLKQVGRQQAMAVANQYAAKAIAKAIAKG